MDPSSRSAFAHWLRRENLLNKRRPIRQFVIEYGRSISAPSAYRAAIDARVRGGRRNRSQYDLFWSELNWHLPDRALAAIWQIDRSNVRARRLRLGMPRPRWSTAYEVRLPGFATAMAAERLNAARFNGPRPDPAQRRGNVGTAVPQ